MIALSGAPQVKPSFIPQRNSGRSSSLRGVDQSFRPGARRLRKLCSSSKSTGIPLLSRLRLDNKFIPGAKSIWQTLHRYGYENYFIMDFGPNAGRPVYELSLYFYMKLPEGFEPRVQSHTFDGLMERMEWVAPDDARTIYPDFFREELQHPEQNVKHFVTDDRGGK